MQGMPRELWIICAGFVAAMHIGKLPPAVPVLQQELGISFVEAGLLLSLVQSAGMLCALIAGSYTEKIGLKRCVLLGLGLLAIASVLGSVTHSVSMLFGLRMVEGFGFLMITLSGPAYLRQLVSSEKLATRMGLWTAYMGGGMGISLIAVPFLITLMGWQGAWQLLACISAVLALIVWRCVPAPQQSSKNTAIFYLIKMTLSHPPAWLLAGIFGVYAGQWFSLVGFLPTIYQQSAISLQLSGILTACVSIANALGTFACGMMLQRGLKAYTLVQFGFAILIVCALSFFILKDDLPFLVQYLSVFSFSLFGGLVASVVFSQALHFAPQAIAISTTVGLILQFSATSQFFLPPIIANIVSQTGSWLWVGIIMALMSIVGMLLSYGLFKKIPSR